MEAYCPNCLSEELESVRTRKESSPVTGIEDETIQIKLADVMITHDESQIECQNCDYEATHQQFMDRLELIDESENFDFVDTEHGRLADFAGVTVEPGDEWLYTPLIIHEEKWTCTGRDVEDMFGEYQERDSIYTLYAMDIETFDICRIESRPSKALAHIESDMRNINRELMREEDEPTFKGKVFRMEVKKEYVTFDSDRWFLQLRTNMHSDEMTDKLKTKQSHWMDKFVD